MARYTGDSGASSRSVRSEIGMTADRERRRGWIRVADGAPGLATAYLDSRRGGTWTRDGAPALAS